MAHPQKALWELLDAQHGVARRSQILAVGMSKGQLRGLVDRGVLKPVAYGILRATGSPPTRDQAISIGILIARAHGAPEDPQAAACLLTAAALLDLAEDEDETIHILARRKPAARKGYRFHWTSRLPAEELVQVRGLWCTDHARTFLDVCDVDRMRGLWTYRRGLRKGTLSEELVAERIELESRQGRGGLNAAREIIGMTSPSAARAKSALEDQCHDFLVEAGYPPPIRNYRLEGSFGHPWEVDLYYPQIKVGFEISPYETHGDPQTHARDGRKELDLGGRGIKIWRITDDFNRKAFLALVRPILGAPESFPCRERVGGEPPFGTKTVRG